MKTITCLLVFLIFHWSYSQDFRYGKVSTEELQEIQNPKDPEANATILYVNHKTYYDYNSNDGFVQVTDVFKRIKIYNKDGFDWATETIRVRENGSKRENVVGLKATTYNLVNGKIEETKLKKDGIFNEKVNKFLNNQKFTMPNIKEGSVVEFEYRITSPYMSIDDVNLQYGIPIKELEASVRIPEYFNFNKFVNPRATYIPKINDVQVLRTENVDSKNRTHNGKTSTTTFSSNTWEFKENKTEVKASNVPALKNEEYVSNLNTYRTKLVWEYAFFRDPNGSYTNYATTWDEVAKTISKESDFGGQLKQSHYFEEDVTMLLKDAKTDLEKINLIFNFVKSKVKWNNYFGYITENGVKQAYKEGSGNVADINLMLTAMLRFAKINANPMLISTRANDIPLFPGTGGFNYVVAAVEMQNDVIVLDATDKFSTPNVLPIHAINWQGMIVKESGTSAWYDLTPKEAVREVVILNAKINDDFTIDGKVKHQMTSFAAKDFRSKHQNFSADEKLLEVEKDKGEIEITNYDIKDQHDVHQPLVYVFDYSLKSGVEKIGDKVFVTPMLFFALKENPFKQDKRNYPIDYIYPYNDKYQVNIMIPEGYAVESMPESMVVQFNDSEGEFKYIANENGKMLQFVITIDLKQSLILPEDYADFKQFNQLMTDKQSEKIVLKKI
ncbi:DUF3857 domain-containing protein [Gelidibacter salicanalis]|uniref:DUF3857 domain-containing protein n=1 Tax=Gelidibacter salicanalis TaxID=291193 RepID=A0A5C7AEX9_9FLAO|nr:transglutaminase domain-containing protein [Gelidibacter salicanalis]TXE06847.1 DUF3857 domain-containing protein [Gelidibacter salicanalis]